MLLQCLPSSFTSIQHSLWGDVVWRVSRWLTWWPSWILEQNDFSNSKSPCGPSASHQVWVQSDFGFGNRCSFKIFKKAAQRPPWTAKRNNLSNSESLSLQCLPSSFGSIQPKVWEEMSFEEFQDGHHGSHLGYQNRMIMAILNLCNAPMPPIKFQPNLTYSLGGDIIWRISTWPLWRPSWI